MTAQPPGAPVIVVIDEARDVLNDPAVRQLTAEVVAMGRRDDLPNHVVLPGAVRTPPSAFVPDPAHLTVAALADVHAYMVAAHADYAAEQAAKRAAGA